MAIIKNKYVALPVVKKLPVLFSGNISTMNKKIKGIIILLYFKGVSKKYFLRNELYNVIVKINNTNIKPIIPVSVKISK